MSACRSEEACREYLLQLRWPMAFRCPRCGCERVRRLERYCCAVVTVDIKTSVTAGTIFQDTRTSLRLWFRIWWWSVRRTVSARWGCNECWSEEL